MVSSAGRDWWTGLGLLHGFADKRQRTQMRPGVWEHRGRYGALEGLRFWCALCLWYLTRLDGRAHAFAVNPLCVSGCKGRLKHESRVEAGMLVSLGQLSA